MGLLLVHKAKRHWLAAFVVATFAIGTTAAVQVSAAPPTISSCLELQAIESKVTYVLAHDIDCSGTADWDGGAGFRPLGINNPKADFQASINGNGYTITGLYINRPETDNVGLYSRATGISLTNIRFDDVSITGRDGVGMVAGSLTDSTVENVRVSGSVRGKNNVGGVAGTMTGSISRSIATGNVDGTGRTGGFVGSTSGPMTIQNVINSATVSVTGESTDSAAGGIVGQASGLVLSNALGSGPVTVTGNVVGAGGIIGVASASSRIDHAVAVAKVSSNATSGGIAGAVDATSAINNSYWSSAETSQTKLVGQAQAGAITSGDAVADMTVFQAVTNQAPLNNWNFSTIWQSWPDSLPLLRGFTYLTITTDTLTDGEVGKAYLGQSIRLSQPHGPVNYQVTDGKLPAGLQLDMNNGSLTGTPDTAGSYAFTITARDRLTADSQAYSLTVSASTPTAPSPGSQTGNGGISVPAPGQYLPPTSGNQAVNSVQKATGVEPRNTYSAGTLQPAIPPVAVAPTPPASDSNQPAVLGQQLRRSMQAKQSRMAPAVIDAQHIYDQTVPGLSTRMASIAITWLMPTILLGAIVVLTASSFLRRPVNAMQTAPATSQAENLQQLIERARYNEENKTAQPTQTDEGDPYLR